MAQQTLSANLSLTVAPSTRRVLAATDIVYKGSYVLSGNIISDMAYSSGLTHYYNASGQLCFLFVGYAGGKNHIVEFKLPAGGFGSTVTARSNLWQGLSVWIPPYNIAGTASVLVGSHNNITAEDLGGGDVRLWGNNGIDYPQDAAGYGRCAAISVRTLHADGTVSGNAGPWGYQGVSQRCIFGKTLKTPDDWKITYGFDDYLIFGGSYASLLSSGGQCSLGLFAITSADPSTTTAPFPYPPVGYSGHGDDFSFPTGTFTILADHRSGASTGINGPDATHDRGWRMSIADGGQGVENCYEGGAIAARLSGTATWTNGSPTITFSVPQTLSAGDWIGPDVTGYGGYVIGKPEQLLVGAVNGTTGTLSIPWNHASVTTFAKWLHSPPNPADPSGNWLTPQAVDGHGRWEWGASYFGTAALVNSESAYGILCTFAGAGGSAWYWTPGNTLGSTAGAAEIHVFDPAHLQEVALGTRHPSKVQPVAWLDITPILRSLGMCTLSHNREQNCPVGATIDPTTNCYWVFCVYSDPAHGGASTGLLSCFEIANF